MAGRQGFSVLWGHCLDGDWAPPYAPFTEALEALGGALDAEELRADLGSGGPALAQLVPAVRERLPDLPEPAPVQPDEERFRLLDAVAQLLSARARRTPVLLCLDDLHWADRSTVAMIRHVARFAPGHRLLIVGTYRDAEVGPAHPLTEALGGLRREVEFERLKLEGLEAKAVGELLDALADHDVVGSVAAAIAAETDGNPFFIKEVLRHLLDEGRFLRGRDGRWTSDRPVAELGIPEGVREVIDRRLTRLSTGANKLLSAASAFEGEIHLDVVAAVAGLDEDDALDALDEALDAQLLQPAGGIDVYGFTHALIRHTLSSELSPSRRGRLHLRAAEALQAASGADPSLARSGEIASQYHRAAGLPGAERGVEPALAAAAHAETTGAHDEAARFLRMALDLLPEGDSQRPALSGRLGLALVWALRFDDAALAATEAAEAISRADGPEAAADYLADAAYATNMAGSPSHAWPLARTGLQYAGARRDVAWARLVSFDCMRREAENPDHPGMPVDTPERAEAARILRAARLDPVGPSPAEAVFGSREEALQSTNLTIRMYWAGEFATVLGALETEAERALGSGQLNRAARCFGMVAICQTQLGRLEQASASLEQARALAARVGQPVFAVLQATETLSLALDDGLDELTSALSPLTSAAIPGIAWALGIIYGWAARANASLGRADEALRLVGLTAPWLERAPAWTVGMPVMAANAAEVLWLLERTNRLHTVEEALREKVVPADFRSPMVDGRLALARLCALTDRVEEARHWFTKARAVLAEQGARPLLAVADYDEALMHVRRDEAGDRERARPLLDAAHRQFEEIGMTGWMRRAEELSKRLG